MKPTDKPYTMVNNMVIICWFIMTIQEASVPSTEIMILSRVNPHFIVLKTDTVIKFSEIKNKFKYTYLKCLSS